MTRGEFLLQVKDEIRGKKRIAYNSKLMKDILSLTNFLPDKCSYQERLYCIRNEKLDTNCIECNGANGIFSPTKQKHICKKCNNLEKKAKTEKTCIDKYGVKSNLLLKESREKANAWHKTDESRKLKSKIIKNAWECNKKNWKENIKKSHNTEDYKEKMRDIAIENNFQERLYTKSSRSDIMKKRWENKDYKESQSKAVKEWWDSPDSKDIRKKFSSKQHRDKLSRIGLSLWETEDHINKMLKSFFRKKEYSLPSGKKVKVQGYEDKALDILLKEYKECDIIIDYNNIKKLIGEIRYEYNERKNRLYIPDFYIVPTNTIIEVKSEWTYNYKKEKNDCKEKRCKEMGLNFKFMIL